MANFDTVSTNETIEIHWETVFELDISSFQIWRSTTGQRGDAIPLSSETIFSRGNSSNGATYLFIDEEVVWGEHYTYWLQTLSQSEGSIDVGSATSWLMNTLYLPLVNR